MPLPVADPADIAAVQDVLKEVFPTDELESQLYEGTIALDFFEEVTEYTNSDGDGASVPLKVGRSGAVGARGVGELLPPADHQKPAKARYFYKNLYVTVQLYGPVIAKMKTNRQACVREVDFEVNGALQDFKRDFCRQLHNDGSGVLTLAALPGHTNSATVPLGAGNYPVVERGFLYEGLPVDVGTLADPDASGEGLRITDVDDSDPAAPAITLNVAATFDSLAGDVLTVHGNRGATSNGYAVGSREIMGLAGIVADDVELGEIDPTVAGNRYWKSFVNDNGGTLRALSLSLMNTTYRKTRQKGGNITDLLCGLGIQQKYYELLQPQVRFAGGASLESGKIDSVQYNSHGLKADPDCLPYRVYFIEKGALQMYSAGPIAWQNQTTGGDILAWRQDYDAFVARAAKYCDVGTDRRPSFALLDDIAE